VELVSPDKNAVPRELSDGARVVSWSPEVRHELNTVFAPRWYLFDGHTLETLQPADSDINSSLRSQFG
jgi:hypothetical protein